MPLDQIQFLADLLPRHERVVEMALLELVVSREEGFVVVEVFYCRKVRGVSGKAHSKRRGEKAEEGKEHGRGSLLSSGSARKR